MCLTASNPLPAGAPGFSAGGVYSSGAGITTDPATGQIDLSTSHAGTYTVTYSVAASGCNPSGSGTATISLNAPTAAVTGFSYPSPLCASDPDPAPLLDPGFTPGGSFSGSGISLNTGNGVVSLSNTAPGTYTINYNVGAANCVLAGTGSATLNVHAMPVISISSAMAIITGEQASLSATGSTNTYTWSPASGLSCVICPAPLASPAQTTMYCVTTTDGVCSSSACVTVNVKTLCEDDNGIFLPNAFSPNADGTNDLFCVQGSSRCISSIQMLIYNRWGEKVFESADLSSCWDGTYKGKLLSPDVYVYYVRARDLSQREIVKNGNVTLLK